MQENEKCSYCGVNSHFVCQKNENHELIWGICFDCVRKAFRKQIGYEIITETKKIKTEDILDDKKLNQLLECYYCSTKSYFIFKKKNKTDEYTEIAWVCCLSCLKDFFERTLGKAKIGGWVENPSETMKFGPAVRCSYCQKLFQDDERHKMGFETNGWGICADCTKNAFDESLEEDNAKQV